MHVHVSDYIHDNCEGGRVERFNLYCSAALARDNFNSLTTLCDEMGGQLTWFDTLQEHTALMERLVYYQSEFNDYLMTGMLPTIIFIILQGKQHTEQSIVTECRI